MAGGRRTSEWSQLPAVPLGAGLLALVALPLWAVSTIRAKDATHAIFSDFGLQVDWVNRTTHNVEWAVAVLTPLVALFVLVNVLLAWWHAKASPATRPDDAHNLKAAAAAMVVADWMLLLVVALTLAGMVTWLWDMTQINSALGGDPALPFVSGKPGTWRVDAAAAEPADARYGVWPIPDFGAKTHAVLVHLVPALVGVLALFCAATWLLMYQVAQYVQADACSTRHSAAHVNELGAALLPESSAA